MAIYPEYAEEGLMEEQEEEVERQAGNQLPPWEDIGEAEVVEHDLSERETQRSEPTDGQPASRQGGVDGKPDDFESPDGWVVELPGHVDEEVEAR